MSTWGWIFLLAFLGQIGWLIKDLIVNKGTPRNGTFGWVMHGVGLTLWGSLFLWCFRYRPT
uniref:Uncharacterized protein n=1 Tax=viral metagenome TaxID=1070528 RepID=A0A6C0JXU2_9ZZZZ